MGHQSWCIPEQTVFLAAQLPRLDEEKINHGLTPFYTHVAVEFIEHWESPTPTKPCPEGVSSKQHADNKRISVSVLTFSLFHGHTLTTATSANC